MPCDGVTVLAAQEVKTDALRELSTPAGRRGLCIYLEGKNVRVEEINFQGGGLWIRVPGGNLVLRQKDGKLEVVSLGKPAAASEVVARLPAVGVALSRLLLQQKVLDALQKMGLVEKVTRAPGGAMVVEADLRGVVA